MDFQKEAHELIAERTGSRRLADFTLYCAIAGVISGGLMAVGGLIYATNRWLISPLLKAMPSVPVSDALGSPAVVSAAVTVLLLVLVGFGVWRWFRGWERVLHGAIDSYVGSVRERVKHLEENTVALSWVTEFQKSSENNDDILEKRIDGLDSRLKKLEPNPYEFALPPALHTESFDAGKLMTLGSLMNVIHKPKVLTIEHARYGFGDKWSDVTEFVRNLVRDGRELEFKVRNENLGGDPYPHQKKELKIVYSINGVQQTPRFWKEKDVCQLP